MKTIRRTYLLHNDAAYYLWRLPDAFDERLVHGIGALCFQLWTQT